MSVTYTAPLSAYKFDALPEGCTDMQSIHIQNSTCMHIHTCIHTYVANVVLASSFETMNHIAANRVTKKLKTRNIRKKHVTHPKSHNPLFQLWGHASKSRQLPHLGKAFRQHLLPLHFMRDASKMSQTIGVSSARFVRNVAYAGNSCVPRLGLQSVFSVHYFISYLSGCRRFA